MEIVDNAFHLIDWNAVTYIRNNRFICDQGHGRVGVGNSLEPSHDCSCAQQASDADGQKKTALDRDDSLSGACA
ncbi:MAG: hypothetical protein EBS79_13335 [Gammaproteobacteria bacterium]|nr:hypothetical protein [Gammaproteobacteria bacterium]